MKPVLILQHLSADGPGHLGTWLARHGVPFVVRNTEAGETFPDRIDAYRALAILGGEMSANDPLPSLRQAEALIRHAVATGVPAIGHCLGGQLMARALGGSVGASPAPEIGWQSIEVNDDPLARAWFGDAPRATVFHWHAEAFELPPGARALATSAACPQQAFAIGPHLAMQFHIELDAAKLARWSASQDPEFLRLQSVHATVSSGAAMREQGAQALAPAHALAERLYARWLDGAA